MECTIIREKNKNEKINLILSIVIKTELKEHRHASVTTSKTL